MVVRAVTLRNYLLERKMTEIASIKEGMSRSCATEKTGSSRR